LAVTDNDYEKIPEIIRRPDLERIVLMNEKTDLSSARKIIAAGGHPGGEV